jgi:carboxylesterase
MSVAKQGNPFRFIHRRGPLGCLLLHGFPGSPAEMRPLGRFLAERDISVFAPVLPGFATIPEDLRGVRWLDWVAAGEAGLYLLERGCSTLFVCGLSMGGALALFLGAHVPVAGVIALAPALRVRDRRFEWAHLLAPFHRWVASGRGQEGAPVPQGGVPTWHYRRYPANALVQFLNLVRATRRTLRKVQRPTLIVQSRADGTLYPEGARWAYEQIPAADKTLLWLERSRHNVVVGEERERVFEEVCHFIERVAGRD